MKKFGVSILASFGAFLPVLALAQDLSYFTDLGTSANTLVSGTLIPLVFAIALLVFLWGMFLYFIKGGGDEEAQTKGRQLMVYAIVGFVVMVSVWGIVGLVQTIFGVQGGGTINIPDLPTS